MYAPREDSFLLEKHVRLRAKGKVLDMGTGSGIQAFTALKNANVACVTAADTDKEVIKELKEKYKGIKKIKFTLSDLFSSLKNKKFDTIIFNPPYLPEEEPKDIALDGGKKGHELLERFFCEAKNSLNEKGIILVVFSSLTNKKKVDGIIKRNNFRFKMLEEEKMFFEKLYVYLVFEA